MRTKGKGGRKSLDAGGRSFGMIRKLPSGRLQASYADPDGRSYLTTTRAGEEVTKSVRHIAPQTFQTRQDAETWLVDERRLISSGAWTPPSVRHAAKAARQLTFGDYAEAWLVNRKVKGRALADRTRDHYRDLLDRYILPTFQDLALKAITSEDVDRWYDLTAVGKPTTQAHAYSLLRTILGTAVDRGHLPYNPAKIRGGGTTKRASKTKIATLEELALITTTMPERRRLMILLAAWCSLRFGELAELRRGDVNLKTKVIHIRRGVVRVRETAADGTVTHVRKVKTPKSDAGVRDVPIPPHLLDDVKTHLDHHVSPGKEALLFPGRVHDDGAEGHLSSSAFYGHEAKLNKDGTIRRRGDGYFEARRQAGRPDLRFHDLRHTGLTNAAIAGATLAELMQLAGHSTAGAAMRYQNVAKDRMQDLAKRLSDLAQASDTRNQ